MLNKFRFNYVITLLLAMAAFVSCKKNFLDRPPLSSLTDANFYKTDDQVMAATALLYSKVWFDYNDKSSYSVGDIRGGVMYDPYGGDRTDQAFFNAGGDNANIAQSWNCFFTVIAQSNLFLLNIERFGSTDVTPAVKKQGIAEARYMRALAYQFLVMNFGEVPVIENNFESLYDTSITRNTIPSVWRFITGEFRAAADDLPETATAEGRLTKWSAEGMLARSYLIRSGVESSGGTRKQEFLDSAKYYADRVITLSGKQLLPDYADLFKYPYDNNKESLFELQWVFTGGNGTYGLGNSMVDQLSSSKDLCFNDWGGAVGATWWMLSLYDGFVLQPDGTLKGKTVDQRLKATYQMPGTVYPEIIALSTGKPYEVPFTANATPADAENRVNVKKYFVGTSNIQGAAATQNYPYDTYMQRLAEMYLIYADAVIGNNGSTTDATAIDYFNAVHTRAGLPAYSVGGGVGGQGAQGPLTLETVMKERFIEFSMEARAWYDIVSLHYYNPQGAYDLINSQYRGRFFVTPDVTPDPTQWTMVMTSYETSKYANVSDANFYLSIPNNELSQAPNLKKPAVDYP